MIVGCIVVALSVIFPIVQYRDSANVYTYMAKMLRDGAYNVAFHPDIPSLNVLLSYPLTFVGVAPETAMILISGLFYLGTIPMLYFVLNRFIFSRLSAFGALLFAAAPKVICFSCTGLIDSGKVFFLTMSLLFAYKFIDGKFRSYKDAALFGVGLGGLCLARSEGIANSVVMIGCVGCVWLYNILKNKKIATFSRIALTLSIWIAFIFSRMLVFYCVFGEFIYDSRMTKFMSSFFKRGTAQAAPQTVAVSEGVGNSTTILRVILQNVRGAYEPYFAVAVLGILLILALRSARLKNHLWKEGWNLSVWQWRAQYWLMLIVIISNILIFKMVGVCAYRYFLLNIPMLMVFTLGGVYWLWLWLGHFAPRSSKPLAIALCAFILIAQVVNGEGHQFSKKSWQKYRTGVEAGRIIRQENPNAKVWYIYASVEWYYTETEKALEWGAKTPDAATFADFDYCLWKSDERFADIIAARKDLEEIPLPPNSTAKLYRKLAISN